MAVNSDTVSMALFCDFENVALGVRDAKYEKFDIRPVLERLLLKGSIVVKKAYCDWDRYKGFKAAMHEANFELIEIPHVRQSGKNSADIRLVVDALDLCYTKSHVDTFVIISGDSDFSPLVSKLRENAKHVIGVGVKQSTSDLLIANCDEFIFYDDIVREIQRQAARRDPREAREGGAGAKRAGEDEKRPREEMEARRTRAIELAVSTFDALVDERGDSGKIWASVLKEAIKRRKPDFNEARFGFRAFGNLLEEAQARGLLAFGRDEKSGAYVYRTVAAPAAQLSPAEAVGPVEEQSPSGSPVPSAEEAVFEDAAAGAAGARGRRQGRGAVRKGSSRRTADAGEIPVSVEKPVLPAEGEDSGPVVEVGAPPLVPEAPQGAADQVAGLVPPVPVPPEMPRPVRGSARKTGRRRKDGAAAEGSEGQPVSLPVADKADATGSLPLLEPASRVDASPESGGESTPEAESRPQPARPRRSRKPKAGGAST